MEAYLDQVLWIVIVAFIVSFVLSFGIGANDVANSFATAIGSNVLTLRQACVLASIFEVAGAVLLGYKVSDTIRKGILDISLYEGAEKELMLGMLASLISCAIWLLVATLFKFPVSATHSIVGATVGFGLVARGTVGIQWSTVISITLSWIVSPLLAGFISMAIYLLIYKFVLRAKSPFSAGLIALPIIWGVVIFINTLGISLDGSRMLGLHHLEVWMSFTIAGGLALSAIVIVQCFVVPYQRKKVLGIYPYADGIHVYQDASSIPIEDHSKDDEARVNLLFHFVQILAAIFSSFAHGGNDVANAIGPLITIWLIYTEGTVTTTAETPIALLAYGGIGIVLGLWILGKRVIETVGFNLTKITPATAITIESGSAMTVLLASKVGVPISTTHCKVGAVTFVGWVYGKTFNKNSEKAPVNWKLFGGIVAAWVITLPVSAGISALLMLLFKLLI